MAGPGRRSATQAASEARKRDYRWRAWPGPVPSCRFLRRPGHKADRSLRCCRAMRGCAGTFLSRRVPNSQRAVRVRLHPLERRIWQREPPAQPGRCGPPLMVQIPARNSRIQCRNRVSWLPDCSRTKGLDLPGGLGCSAACCFLLLLPVSRLTTHHASSLYPTLMTTAFSRSTKNAPTSGTTRNALGEAP